jgi:hypothetical protein
MKDKVILFLLYAILVPMVVIVVFIFAIREEIEHRRSYGSKAKPKGDLPHP